MTVAALGVSYFGLQRAPFHRVGLALVLVTAAAGGLHRRVPWAWPIETTGMRFLYVWSVADIVLISFAVAATGGGRSDLFLLYTLTTFFFVRLHHRCQRSKWLALLDRCAHERAVLGP